MKKEKGQSQTNATATHSTNETGRPRRKETTRKWIELKKDSFYWKKRHKKCLENKVPPGKH